MKVDVIFRHYDSEQIPSVEEDETSLSLHKFVDLLKSRAFGELVTVQFECPMKSPSGEPILNPPIIYTVNAENVDTKKFLGFLKETKEQ
jgi:hypothetical protein